MVKQDGIIIIGASGHGKVVLSTLLASGKKVLGFVDDNESLIGSKICGYSVISNVATLAKMIGQEAIIAIGDNRIRYRVVAQLPNCHWQIAIHPTAYIDPSVIIQEGTVIFAGAILQADAKIGRHVIVNTGASIDHDCSLQDFVHIAPGTRLAGNVAVGEGSLLGIQSCVLPNKSVGKWSIIGAGSVIVHNIADKKYAKGMPASEYKENTACFEQQLTSTI